VYTGSTYALTMLCTRDVRQRDNLLHGPPPNHYWHSLHATDPAAGSTEHPSRPTLIVLLHASKSRDARRLYTTVGTTVPVVPGCILGDKWKDTCVTITRYGCCNEQVSLRFLRTFVKLRIGAGWVGQPFWTLSKTIFSTWRQSNFSSLVIQRVVYPLYRLDYPS
jgi:hypothetical protein